MEMVCLWTWRTLPILEIQKWGCLRNDKWKCRRGTAMPPYAASEEMAVLVGELHKWECLRKT